MGLLGMIVTLPLAPIRGVSALAKVIQQRAEEEMTNPATARRELEELEEAHVAGELSDEEVAQAEEAITQRMTGDAVPSAPS